MAFAGSLKVWGQRDFAAADVARAIGSCFPKCLRGACIADEKFCGFLSRRARLEAMVKMLFLLNASAFTQNLSAVATLKL